MNRLKNEKSPYLLQHAHNPVDWFPWGEEAFEKARNEDKPVFLSVGYSTCHWCHVMEKESFEDAEVAELLNRDYVAIKVDREERPDVDSIYMSVCQAMTGGGGWPLTVLLTPDKRPFYAGTYFPKEGRYNKPGMIELLPRISELWKTKRQDLETSAAEIVASLEQQSLGHFGELPGKELGDKAYGQFLSRFDSVNGGFGNAPKFPTPHNFLFLLRYYKSSGEKKALEMCEKTLEAMRLGGMYDHIGFGFHRYSTDKQWILPHFEKMLYDQAMLVLAYAELYQITGKLFYREVIEETLSYVQSVLTSPEGGFYSAEDADSEGEEGKFYLWKADEIKNLLGERADIVISAYNILAAGNYHDPFAGGATGENILYLTKNFQEAAADKGMSTESFLHKLREANKILFFEREKRIKPHKDDKILADWNGLMIAAFAKAGSVLGNKRYIEDAQRAADFILENMTTPEGGLLHRYRDGDAAIKGMLEDYAFLTAGLLELYEATFDIKWLKKSVELTDVLIDKFRDDVYGGFYFTASDGEELILRQKDIYDGAIPSGNSVAILNLLKLSRLTGNVDYEHQAVQSASSFASSVEAYPAGYTQYLSALDFIHSGSFEIVVAGDKNAENTIEMLNKLRREYIPARVILFKDKDDRTLTEIAPYIKDYGAADGNTKIYVCKNFQCSLPVSTFENAMKLINGE